MAIISATATRTWMTSHLRGRDVTAAGVGFAAVRLSVEQLAGQAAGQAGTGAASLQEWLPGGGAHVLEWIVGAVALAAGMVDGWTSGLASTALTLVLPVGGPVWAGVVPLGATVAGTRKAARTIGRTLSNTSGPQVPAVGNAPRITVGDHGLVTLSILVVDDSSPFRDLARRLLARDGFEVVGTASTCAEALSRVAALRPQVALVDINLGADSGFEVARRIDADPQAVGTSVVLMSTHSEDEYADLIAESPAAGFVAKEQLSGSAVRLALSGGGA